MPGRKFTCILYVLVAAGCSLVHAEQKLFTSFSIGSGVSGGSYELENFYDPSFGITAELGYMVTPSLGIVPVSLSYHKFDFDSRKYADNFWDYRDEYKHRVHEENPGSLINWTNITDFDASSVMHGIFFTPGAIYFSPDIYNFRGFIQAGAGIYSAKVSLGETKKTIDSVTGAYDQEVRLKRRVDSFATLLGGGVEYRFIDMASFTLQFKYYLAFTRDDNQSSRISGGSDELRIYYVDNGELRFHRFLEEKNTRIMELAAGLRFHF